MQGSFIDANHQGVFPGSQDQRLRTQSRLAIHVERNGMVGCDAQVRGAAHQHPGTLSERAAEEGRNLLHDAQQRLLPHDHEIEIPIVETGLRGNLGALAVLARVGERDEERGFVKSFGPACPVLGRVE